MSATVRIRPLLVVLVGVVLAGLVAEPAGAAPRRPGVPSAPAVPAEAPLIDPGAAGPHGVDELSYDFGDQAFQPSGFSAAVEVRAKVYAPQEITGRAPLVILQHGRHVTCATATRAELVWPCPPTLPEVPSYRGYDALGRLLASQGMVVVSIGANGINANDGYLADGGASARAQLILEHLRRWRDWDASDAGSPFGSRFVGHIDLERVGLMGHSRGGEGVVAAVQLNQRRSDRFGIKAALALAPVDFGRRVVGGVELGVVLPYCDGDVSDLQGALYYDDGRYATPGDRSSKMTALLYGANHNFFNTVWTTGPGSFDDAGGTFGGQDAGSAVDPCRPGGRGRLTAAQQEQAGAALMAGFLRRTLGPEPGLARFVTGTAPYPPSAGTARWSIAYHAPDRLDIETWSSLDTYRRTTGGALTDQRGVTTGLVCNLDDDRGFSQPSDVRVVTTRCATADPTGMVNDTGVLDAGWVRPGPFVRIPLAATGVDVTGYDGLRLRVGVWSDSRNTTRAQQDFSVVIEDADGARSSLPASTGTNGLQRLNGSVVQHAVLNGLRLPLASFSGVDLTRVRAVELRFDRTGAGRLAFSDLAFTQEGTGAAPSTLTGFAATAPPRSFCRYTPASRWGCAVAELAWGRDPTPDEVAWLARGYATATSRQQAIGRALGGPTAAGLHHSRIAQTFTQDEIDLEWITSTLSASGRRYWDAATIDIIAGLAGSSPSLASPADSVRATYETLLGRPADPSGLAYWTPKVARSGTRGLAAELRRSATARGRIVDDRYQQILGRSPDAAGRSYWVAKLAKPGGEQALVASLLATESFRAAAVH